MIIMAPLLGVRSMTTWVLVSVPRSMVRVKSSHGWVGAWHRSLRRAGALPLMGADSVHVAVGVAALGVAVRPAAWAPGHCAAGAIEPSRSAAAKARQRSRFTAGSFPSGMSG